MSIYDAFENGIVTEEDLSPFYDRYEHVIKAAAASSELKPDGSNIESVYDDIDEIFSKGVESEETITSRWQRFLQRCKEQDTSLHGKLYKERQTRASIQVRDQIRRDSSNNQQQKMTSFDMLKSNFMNKNKK